MAAEQGQAPLPMLTTDGDGPGDEERQLSWPTSRRGASICYSLRRHLSAYWLATDVTGGAEAPIERLIAPALGILFVAAACSQPADVASENLSTAADNFELDRRIVFYNGITDTYMLEIEGRCSLGNDDGPTKLTVTCKTGDDEYKKHFLGLSDNVTYFVEQLEGAEVSEYH